ncbi:MAG: ABC transporter permease [Ruthenibacterium sp.]
MLLFENMALAVSGLLANKMRALLTMLGIIIGIGSVIAIMTVGDSLTNSLTSNMQSMGASNINVSLTQKQDTDYTEGGYTLMFRPNKYKADDLMTDDMIAQYREKYADSIYAIGLTQQVGDGKVTLNQQTAKVAVMGVNAESQKVQNITLINGRFVTDADSDKAKPVAVVSDAFCKKLFPDGKDPIGQSFNMTFGNKIYTFYIVGVYQYEDNGMMMNLTGESPTTDLYLPLKTGKRIAAADAGYSDFTVVGSTAPEEASDFVEETKRFFAGFYTRNNSYTVTAGSMESMMKAMTDMMGTVSLGIAVIAGISLLVGGIGVMNIMLVSITERTREIGTRKALGATNGSIRLQFIVESIIICLIGGIIGIFLGMSLGSFGAKLLGYAATPSPAVIAIAVSFSMCIGVFFGYYPANKAAKLDPVEALRYE